MWRERGHVCRESVPAGDLEGDERDLPRPGWRAQRTVDPPNVQHVDRVGAESYRPTDGDAVHQASVEVVLALQFDRRQQPGYGGGGEHGLDQGAVGEPAFSGSLDAGG